jgi:hypothetical protein
MLDRLAEDGEVRAAFAVWRLDDEEGRAFVAACRYAFYLDRGGHAAQAEALRAAGRNLVKIQAHIDKLEALLASAEPALGESACEEAFGALRAECERRKFMRDFFAKGMSRNSNPTAARSRAIGELKTIVRLVSGRPKLGFVAALARVVFAAKGAIDRDTVRKAQDWWGRQFS